MYKKPIIDLYIEELDVSSNMEFDLEETVVDLNMETCGKSSFGTISVNGVVQKPDEHDNIDLTIPIYEAGNGIEIENSTIRLSDLILDCGTSTTVL